MNDDSLREIFECNGFTVRLIHRYKIETLVTLSFDDTRLKHLNHKTLDEARHDYRTICDTVRDVVTYLKP